MVLKSCSVNELYTKQNYFSFEKRQVVLKFEEAILKK